MDDIKIIAMEIYDYQRSVVLAECKGRKFETTFQVVAEMLNDGEFDLMSFVRYTVKQSYEALTAEENDLHPSQH